MPWSGGRACRVFCVDRPDGARRWVQLTSVADKAGEWHCLLQDVTRSTEAGHRAEAQFKAQQSLARCAGRLLCASGFCAHCRAMNELLSIARRSLRGLHSALVFENVEETSGDRVARLVSPRTARKEAGSLRIPWGPPLATWAKRLRQGKTLRIAASDSSPAARHFFSLVDAHSAAIFPLRSAGEWLGVLVCADADPRIVRSREDLRSMEQIAAIAAGMLGRKRLQERVLQSQKLEAIGSLAGGLAHDFNNILTGIRGSIELMLHDPGTDSSLHENLHEVLQELLRATDISRQLVLHTQPASGYPTAINLNTQLIMMAKLFRRTLPKSIMLDVDIAPEKVVIEMDPTQAEQIVLNLVLNARDAMPDGGRIRIRTRILRPDEVRLASPGPHGWLEVCVADEGTGIPPAKLPRIFDPFFTTKDPGRGTGLGLSIVRAIVDQHGGRIEARNLEERGAAFTFVLPLASPDLLKPPEERARLESPGGTETILVVDDEPVILTFTSNLLERHGYTVHTAPDAETAIEVFERHRGAIRLALLDVAMPGRGGKLCLIELLERRPDLPVIMMSGHRFESMEWDPLALGAKGYVEKPFEIDELLIAIRQTLDSKPAPSQAPPRSPETARPPAP